MGLPVAQVCPDRSVTGTVNAIQFQPNGEILVRTIGDTNQLILLNPDRTIKIQIPEPAAVKIAYLLAYPPTNPTKAYRHESPSTTLNLYTHAPSDYDDRVRGVFDDHVADSLPIEGDTDPDDRER